MRTSHRILYSALIATMLTPLTFCFVGAEGVGEASEPESIDEGLARARLAVEVEVARSMGFVEVRREPLTRSADRVPLELEGGHCVAVLVGGWDQLRLDQLHLSLEEVSPRASYPLAAVSSHVEIEGLVGHVQWCAEAPQQLFITYTEGYRFGPEREGHSEIGELVVLKAPAGRVGSLMALRRGILSTRPLAARDTGTESEEDELAW